MAELHHRIVNMRTGLPLYHIPQQDQKLLGDVFGVSAIKNDPTVRNNDVADEVKDDMLCPDTVFVFSPVGCDGPECSNIERRVCVL